MLLTIAYAESWMVTSRHHERPLGQVRGVGVELQVALKELLVGLGGAHPAAGQ